MDLNNVVVKCDQRCSVEFLVKLLEKSPLEVSGSEDLEITATMCLGGIIYLWPSKGNVRGWTLGNDARLISEEYGAKFQYGGLTYSMILPRSMVG